MLTDDQLDTLLTLLTLQLATAWAGERSGDEPRLGPPHRQMGRP